MPVVQAAEWSSSSRGADFIPVHDYFKTADCTSLVTEQREELSALAAIYDRDVGVRPLEDGTPLLRIPLGQTTAILTVHLPPRYPAEEVPRVGLTEPSMAPETLRNIALQLEAEAETMKGDSMVYQLVQSAASLVAAVPPAALSEFFVWCQQCAGPTSRLPDRCRYPQPALQTRYRSLHYADREFKCMQCGDEKVQWLTCVRRNAERECSWCFCPENPLIALRCGEEVCTDCFNRCVEEAVGKKALSLMTGQSYGGFTVRCPVHPTTNIFAEPLLVKLLAPATLTRFLNFAFHEGAVAAGLVVCPLPGCTNAPFWPDVYGAFLQCAYCRRPFCVLCHHRAGGCTCKELPPDVPRDQIGEPTVDSCEPGSEAGETLSLLIMAPGINASCDLPLGPAVSLRGVRKSIEAQLQIPVCDQLLLYCGRLLHDNATEVFKDLRVFGVVHVALKMHQDLRELSRLKIRWKLRRTHHVISDADGHCIGVRCPFTGCHKTVVHYRNHGCHHIYGCCGKQWCYNCFCPTPCNCRIFCDDTSSCPWCPECKPFKPCAHCTGCHRCRPDLQQPVLDPGLEPEDP